MTIFGLQFVWWGLGEWRYQWLPKSGGPIPSDGPRRGAVYRWRCAWGPLEIRRWG